MKMKVIIPIIIAGIVASVYFGVQASISSKTQEAIKPSTPQIQMSEPETQAKETPTKEVGTGSAPAASSASEQLALRITASTDKSQYKIGETVQVTITVTNTSDRTFTFQTNPAIIFKVLVFDAFDSKIGSFPNSSVEPLAPPKIIILKPDESSSQLLKWNQMLFDFSEGSFKQVDAGVYNLVGELNLFGEKSFELKPARSSPIQITIVS